MMWNLDIASELRVVGNDPEMADMSNPRGEIIREVWFVTATSDDGRAFAHVWDSEDEGEVGGWLDSIRESVSRATGWNPEGRDAWRHWRNLYGSAAHEAAGDDADGERRDALDAEAREGQQ